MHCYPECYTCLENLARRCVSLAGLDSPKQGEVLAAALDYLEKNFSLDQISTVTAAGMQRVIRSKTGNSDPFAAVKEEELALARRSLERFPLSGSASLRELVQLAAKGNGFDYFQELSMLEKQFQEPVKFDRDDLDAFEELLQGYRRESGKKIVYLADNAGESLFDLPLANSLKRWAQVHYAVKGAPVQNDLSMIDLERSGLLDRFPGVVSTGTDSPGLDLEGASPAFKKLLGEADLIVAKGMGHYETLPELSLLQPVFLIFQVKCNPIAQDSGLPRNSYAAYFLD